MILSESIQVWVSEQIGAIADAQPLSGSTSTTLYRITNADSLTCVLRLYDNAEWLATEPDLCQHEASALQAASLADVATPGLIAYEPDETVAGMPLILMEYLEGQVNLLPDNMNDWLWQSAEALAAIHQVNVPDFAWQHFRYTRPHTLTVPTWTQYPEEWQAAIEILQSEEPETQQSFIHRDFHPTNFLWREGTLTGVVDWINACLGPVGADVGHMRCNLAQLYGVDIADAFLNAYLSANSNWQYDRYWDLVAIADAFLYDGHPPGIYSPWLDFGITDLTDLIVLKRTDDFLRHVVALH